MAQASAPAPSDLAWRVIGLVNVYRLFIPPLLLAIASFFEIPLPIGRVHPQVFLATCLLYFTVAVLLVLVRRQRWPNLRVLTLSHAIIDAVAIGTLVWASGGVASGLGILLVVPVGAMAMLAENRDSYFIAAMATLALLLQQIAAHLADVGSEGDYFAAGVLGGVLFLTSISVRPLANRLLESEATVRRQEIDLANLAQLSQYIVQHLRESILVVDESDRIRLINESAARLLGDANAYPGALLGEASPRLLYVLSTWRQRGQAADGADGTFTAADGARVLKPNFAALGNGRSSPVLIFLEDPGLIAEKVQQSKLAALGRLSASIAHEIRNPIGAMSHAGQLLAESPSLADDDRRLTQIIRGNAERVSEIVENVLQLSRRAATRPERLSVRDWLDEFREEFCATMQWPPEQLRIAGPDEDIEIQVDSSQLQQVVWNLCQNAITHGRHHAPDASHDAVDLRFGILPGSGRPFLEVADRGPGIGAEDSDRVFEPFFTTAARGTGLGLFLARELAQTNGATLLHESRSGGGSIFRLVFSDPGRWQGMALGG